MRAIVTFGANHIHPVSGVNMQRHYVVVEGNTYEEIRSQTVDQFGTRWSFDYVDGFGDRTAEDQAGVQRFELTQVDFETGEEVEV